MEQSTKKKLVIGISLTILLGVGGYFLYNFLKTKKDEKDLKKKADDEAAAAAAAAAEQANKPKSSGGGGTTSPFKTKDEIIKFQQYVINVKGDKTILGKGGSTGFGDDGLWGGKADAAFAKYGADYNKPIVTANQSTPAGFVAGDKVYLKGQGTGLYTYPANEGKYITRMAKKDFFLDKPIGAFISSGPKGWAKIKSVAGTRLSDNTLDITTKDLYVQDYNIQKTPF